MRGSATASPTRSGSRRPTAVTSAALLFLSSSLPSAGPAAELDPEIRARLVAVAWAVACLVAAAVFATLRVALLRSHAGRVLARPDAVGERGRFEPLLQRAERLANSAAIVEATFEVVFLILLYRVFATGAVGLDLFALLWTVLIAVPARLVLGEALPTAVALRGGDAVLLRTLPAFYVLQLPLEWSALGLEIVRRACLRVFGLRSDPVANRQIVEELREVVADAEITGELDETEKEIIGNVMEVRDVSVAAIMTPRTEMAGVEISEGLPAAARLTAETGHSRLPVYEGSLDTILGLITARDVVQIAAEKGLEKSALRSILRPAYFVPETKRVSELLREFKREKIKLAIVLDEYGGTSGLVTLGDIVQEIVGDIRDEFGDGERPRLRRLADGSFEVDAATHVTEVAAEVEIEIPAGDYETLAGYVLAELGHFPQRGEKFVRSHVEFTVTDSSDRRVHKVRIRRLSADVAA